MASYSKAVALPRLGFNPGKTGSEAADESFILGGPNGQWLVAPSVGLAPQPGDPTRRVMGTVQFPLLTLPGQTAQLLAASTQKQTQLRRTNCLPLGYQELLTVSTSASDGEAPNELRVVYRKYSKEGQLTREQAVDTSPHVELLGDISASLGLCPTAYTYLQQGYLFLAPQFLGVFSPLSFNSPASSSISPVGSDAKLQPMDIYRIPLNTPEVRQGRLSEPELIQTLQPAWWETAQAQLRAVGLDAQIDTGFPRLLHLHCQPWLVITRSSDNTDYLVACPLLHPEQCQAYRLSPHGDKAMPYALANTGLVYGTTAGRVGYIDLLTQKVAEFTGSSTVGIRALAGEPDNPLVLVSNCACSVHAWDTANPELPLVRVPYNGKVPSSLGVSDNIAWLTTKPGLHHWQVTFPVQNEALHERNRERSSFSLGI